MGRRIFGSYLSPHRGEGSTVLDFLNPFQGRECNLKAAASPQSYPPAPYPIHTTVSGLDSRTRPTDSSGHSRAARRRHRRSPALLRLGATMAPWNVSPL